MIKVIHRCMQNSDLSFKKWDNHLALFHLKEFKDAKEIYLNGKPLKWYHIFKKGDLIEVIDNPKGIFAALGGLFAALGHLITAVGSYIITVHPVIAGIIGASALGGIVAGVSSAFASQASATTQNKEYSSTTQPELRGASNDISNDIIPVVFGRTQQTPSYAQTPYRLVQDGSSTNKYRQYFIANYNNVVYSDFKLGDTSIDDYSIDYLNIEQASGSNNFIGFENCRAISVDEELSYNADEAVNQSSTHNYNATVTANSLQVDYEIEFENADINNFARKTFKVVATIQRYIDGVLVNLTVEHQFNVNAGDLIPSGQDYVYNGSHTWDNGENVLLDGLISVQIAPVGQTRGNQTETDNELDVILVSETVTADTYTETVTLNTSINNYLGSMSEVLNTSPVNCTEIDVIIGFSQGLYSLNRNSGERYSRSATVEIMYKQEGGQWKPISSANALYIRDVNGNKQPLSSSNTTVSGNKVTVHSPSDMNVADQLFFRPIGFELPTGQYTVRVRSADYSQKTNYDIGYPNCAEIQFRCSGNVVNPIVLPQVNQIAFEATAYKGLSGTLKKFNYIAEAIIPVWNGTDWNTKAKTSNPAAIIRYLLTDSSVNPRAESIDHIDNDSLVEYYEWCEQSGYKADGVVSEACKIGEIINAILQNSQTAMIPLYNGKHTFVTDKPDKIPIGLFNMHNSWNFKWTPNVGRQTEAIRASFVENDDWAEDELTLYWYNGQVNDEPEQGKTDLDYELVKKEYKYVCDRSSVRRIAAYELETIQTKRNQFEFDVNLEAMNMMLLDRVYISNTANMQNESTGLIKSVITDNQGNLTGFELYADVDIPENAKIVIRSLDYDNEKAVINTYDVLNSGMNYIVNIEPIPYNGIIKGAGEITGIQDSWYYDGDLFTLGQDTIYNCTVTDIKYNDDGTATITARDY